MTPQESAMLQDLLGKIQQTTLAEKDPDAEAAIEQSIGSNPDALYILTQTVLVQNIALGQAKTQVEQLRQQVADLQQRASHPARATSFLGALLGHDDPPPAPPARPQVMAPQQQGPYTPPPYQPVQSYPPQGYAPQGSGPYGGGGFFGGGGGGLGGPPSFLRSAATTAAGVAAGALAFEGVESLLHGFGHGGYGGFGGGGFGGGGGVVEENVTNNYYDNGRDSGSGGAEGHEHHEHESFYGAGAGDDRTGTDAAAAGHDVSDARLDDASYDPGQSGDTGTQSDLMDRDLPDDLSSAPDDNTAFDDSNDNFGGGDGNFGDDSASSGGSDLS